MEQFDGILKFASPTSFFVVDDMKYVKLLMMLGVTFGV